VELGFEDQRSLGLQIALNNGVPNMRWVSVPRVGTGPERVAAFWDDLIAAMTSPLTEKEKETGIFNPPPDPRICFSGTLDDAQEFFQKTQPIDGCHNCPISAWTTGLPIIIPTEEKVQNMLTGTSHKPEEQVRSYSRTGPKAYSISENPVKNYPMNWVCTVEKVAVNAVMAGATPEFMPVMLAIATGDAPPSSNGRWAGWVCVSGPIADELGMNAGPGSFNGGNPANMIIGFAQQLMLCNLAGAMQGINRLDFGTPWNRAGTAFAEDDSALPAGWLTFREDAGGYLKSESALAFTWTSGSDMAFPFTASELADLSQGQGVLARALGVEGKPGKYNPLQYVVQELIEDRPNSRSFFIDPALAQNLKDLGFASKQAVLDWLWNQTKLPVGYYRTYGWFDFTTNSGNNTIPGTSLTYNTAPDSYMVPALGSSANQNVIIVTSQTDGAIFLSVTGGTRSLRPIDPWR